MNGPEPLASRFRALLRGASRGYAPYAIALAVSCALALACLRAIVEKAGHPALPLDDSFIHLQYAKRLAEGSFYAFVPGEGFASGATSPLWPAALAPFYLAGLRGLSLVYAAWALGTLAHAALAVETGRIAARLAGAAAGVIAASLCLGFGAFAWFAWSGMETIPLAFLLMRTARVAADLVEGDDLSKSAIKRLQIELLVLAFAAPLVRPEGALASLIAAFALASRYRETKRERLLALGALAGPLVVPLMNLALVGHAASSTTTVKWLVGNPYCAGAKLVSATLGNVALLVTDLINGGPWTAVFVPAGSRAVLLLGLVAIFVVGFREKRLHRAAFVLLIALGALIPCTYLSFLWNRVRYIWPFAPAWIVGVACLARVLGDAATKLSKRLAFVGPLLGGLALGALVSKMPWTISDLAQSASAIDRQQVALGLWAKDELPEDARIGVNDTGAIAYFSERPTFDVVGLTTEGEARYWVAGAGSRFEHYETMPRERLPTHFIVYPQWMACPPVLGRELTFATVLDQSILGGATMVAYEATYDALGSGDLPVALSPKGRLVDEIDVSDLESEAAHHYALGDTWDYMNIAAFDLAPYGEADDAPPPAMRIADGGRVRRARDTFVAHLEAGREATLALRVASAESLVLRVKISDRAIGSIAIPAGSWVERAIDLPPSDVAQETPITIEPEDEAARFDAFHYWLYQGEITDR